jgi:hypothetical protein
MGRAQEQISLRASVDKATITIGDLIIYTITVTRNENVEVQLPALGENLGGFEIRDYHVHDSRRENGSLIDRVDYTISTFETGEFEIPPVEVSYSIPPDGEQRTLKTESIKIVVESVKPSEEGDIREIRPPWEIPYCWQTVILFSLIGLSVLLFALGFIYYIRKKRRGETLLPRKIDPPRPPHEIAYEMLGRLSESGLLEKGKIKKYYSDISEIIRRYVEGRYRITAMELTSTELMEELRAAVNNEEHSVLFESFLELCDLVKFAKYIPSDQENKSVMDLAVQIVDETKFVEEAVKDRMEDLDNQAQKGPSSFEPVSRKEEPFLSEGEKEKDVPSDKFKNSHHAEDKGM